MEMMVFNTETRSVLNKEMMVLMMAHTTHFISQHSTWSFSLTSDNSRMINCTDKAPSINDQIFCSKHSQMPLLQLNAPPACTSSSRPTSSMDIQVPQRLDEAHPCLYFMSILIFRMNSDFQFTLFYSFVTIIEMAVLKKVCPRLVKGN